MPKTIKVAVKINRELKWFHTEPRVDRKYVKDVLTIATNEVPPRGWKSMPKFLLEKVGFETTEIEIVAIPHLAGLFATPRLSNPHK